MKEICILPVVDKAISKIEDFRIKIASVPVK